MLRKVLLLSILLGLLGVVSIAAAQDEVVFGVVLVGPANDRGWSQSHAEGAAYVEENLPGARAVIFESLNPTDAPEVTLQDVVAQMVEEGATVIFTTSDAFEEDTNVAAEAYPDVTFINITGSNVLNGAPSNVGNFMAQTEIPRMISGCAAALTTETGSIGYLGPLINAETRRLAAAAYLGARHCYEEHRGMNPEDLEFTVTWIGFWFNIPGVTLDPTEEANAFFDAGADVVMSGIDTTEAIVVAGQRREQGENTYAIPYGNINGCAEAPEACLGVTYYNWGPAYLNTVQQVVDGTWEQSWDWFTANWDDINDPDASIVGFVEGEALSEEVAATLDEFYAEMVEYSTTEGNEESIYLWQGPLNLQDGTELAPEGEPVELLDIWFLPQLLEGMVGASE